MRKINYIIIHCADTYPDMDIGVKEIDIWHKQRGWKGVGYHYVIRRNGVIENGRPENEVGAHVTNFNAHSIGVCWVGGKGRNNRPEDNRTSKQKQSLHSLIQKLHSKYPNAIVAGHSDFNEHKACPCFDVEEEFSHFNNYRNERKNKEIVGVSKRKETKHRDSTVPDRSGSGSNPLKTITGKTAVIDSGGGRFDSGSGISGLGFKDENRDKIVGRNKTEKEIDSLIKLKLPVLRIYLSKIFKFFRRK